MSPAGNLLPIWCVAAFLAPPGLQAQAALRDSARAPIIRTSELIGLTAALGLGFALDGTVRSEAQASRSAATNSVASIGNSFGHLVYAGPALGATWAVGAITHNRGIRIAAEDALAAGVIAGGITGILKLGFGRVRPRDGGTPGRFRPFSSNASFPSGHTTLAMAVASSLAHSTKDSWSDVFFYSAALVTGYARINDNKHWISDVIAGGAIGFLVGRQLHFQGTKITPIVGPGGFGGSLAF
jgi:membrane-associated phospholipid phosphatase